MSMPQANDQKAHLRVLVAIASYGTSNDAHLKRIIQEYKSTSFHTDIVVVSNVEKRLGAGVECVVGLPNKNPWSLPFAHKKLLSDNVANYDLFVYSEDDILITQGNLNAFLDVSRVLPEDEIAGFLRIEKGPNGAINYPDAHGFFHWDPASVRVRGRYTLAHFTNEHSACYVLTQAQLRKAIESGGYSVGPHEGEYDLLCTAATDPYTQCGLKKLIPISHVDEFCVHHLSNKYVGAVGIGAPELRRQLDALLELGRRNCTAKSLFDPRTRLRGAKYSKGYYEPPSQEVISAIPKSARRVLSIGCASGATEMALVERGVQVVAIPLDPVISVNAAAKGVEIVSGDLNTARAVLRTGKFDCVLYLNVLHLMRDPVEVLSLFRDLCSPECSIIIQSPNMRCVPALWNEARSWRFRKHGDFRSAGVHMVSAEKMNEWCRSSGFSVERTVGIPHRRLQALRSLSIAQLLISPDFVSVARKVGH